MNKLYSIFILLFVSFLTNNSSFAQVAQGPTFALTTQNNTITAGQMVAVQVKVKDFNDIMSYQYSINWNSSKLKYVSVSDFGLPGLDNTFFGINSTNEGVLRSIWYDSGAQGSTLPNDKVIYTINFKAMTSEPLDILFTGSPMIKEVVGSNLAVNGGVITDISKFINLHTPGSVTASTASVKGPTFEMTTPYSNTQPNDIIAVSVNVKDFKDIINFQYSLNWNPQELQYLYCDKVFGLQGFSSINLGITDANQGIIAVSWYDVAVKGISMPDDATITKLYFKSLVYGFSSVNFSNNPAIKEVYNVTNINEITKTTTFIDLKKIVLSQQNPTDAAILNVSSIAPNPFLNQANLTFNLGISGDVILEIYDAVGHRVSQKNGFYDAGTHNINIDTDLMATSGAYIYKIKTNNAQQSGRLMKL